MDSPPSVIKTSFWSTETSSSNISQIIEFDVTARTDLGCSSMYQLMIMKRETFWNDSGAFSAAYVP